MPVAMAATITPHTMATRTNATLSQKKSVTILSDKGTEPEQSQSTSNHIRASRIQKSATAPADNEDPSAWGSNFWVTLVDPQSQTSFFACPATGQVSWDPPVGHFVLPPNAEGEWWELTDDSRGGLPYYYQTKTGETVWERPSGFVIPLGIIQNTALGRRLSNRLSKSIPNTTHLESGSLNVDQPQYRRSVSYSNDGAQDHKSLNNRNSVKSVNSVSSAKKGVSPKRSFTDQPHTAFGNNSRSLSHGTHLPSIPASPYASDASIQSIPQKSQDPATSATAQLRPKEQASPSNKFQLNGNIPSSDSPRAKLASYSPRRSPQPQSLSAAVEMLTTSQSESGDSHGSARAQSLTNRKSSSENPSIVVSMPHSRSSTPDGVKSDVPPSPRRPIPTIPRTRNISAPSVGGKAISGPILNHSAKLEQSPIKNRASSRPIPVDAKVHVNGRTMGAAKPSISTLPVLPHELASDIQLFSESDYAKQYFSTHRTGFIFRRTVPVNQMMAWQKSPLSSPLLTLNRSLRQDAVKVFRVIQRIMGDRERPSTTRVVSDNHVSAVQSINSTSSPQSQSTPSTYHGILEEERWLLGEGITHGELRDEIYCQVVKQVTGNPSAESVFKGWQLLSVLLITFPPSKNFEAYLRSFMQLHTTKQEGRVDVMAKYGIRRLAYISRKGPRGKPPSIAEIETASDAAFSPSTFGESLDAIIRLQHRNYPHQKVPIILPFLADGILALGGTKSEGIFRIPGDGDSVSELKLRIDRGYYTLDGVDDPHILASLMKLWLRELCDPLIPEEMYNECITNSKDPEACVRIVERLPTINRRVVLFAISFLQLFLEERTQSVTKMTPANLALVMAPNLLRCNSDSMSVVFTNAQYEQFFVYNLLLHLKCGEVDADYTPAHGLGAVPNIPPPRRSKSHSRRT